MNYLAQGILEICVRKTRCADALTERWPQTPRRWVARHANCKHEIQHSLPPSIPALHHAPGGSRYTPRPVQVGPANVSLRRCPRYWAFVNSAGTGCGQARLKLSALQNPGPGLEASIPHRVSAVLPFTRATTTPTPESPSPASNTPTHSLFTPGGRLEGGRQGRPERRGAGRGRVARPRVPAGPAPGARPPAPGRDQRAAAAAAYQRSAGAGPLGSAAARTAGGDGRGTRRRAARAAARRHRARLPRAPARPRGARGAGERAACRWRPGQPRSVPTRPGGGAQAPPGRWCPG